MEALLPDLRPTHRQALAAVAVKASLAMNDLERASQWMVPS